MSAPTANYSKVLEPGLHVDRKDGKMVGYTLVDDVDIGARIAILSHFIEALDIPSVKITVTVASRTYLRDALVTYREMVAERGEANRLAREAGVSFGPEWTPAPITPKKRRSRPSPQETRGRKK